MDPEKLREIARKEKEKQIKQEEAVKLAIEKLKETSNQCHNSKECWENESCCDCYVEIEDILAIDMVLTHIEKLENVYKKEYNEHMEMKRQNEVLRNNERILKEKIEELKNKNKDLCENYCPRNKDSIPKQKVRDKIEELKNVGTITTLLENGKDVNNKEYFMQDEINILEELLGEGD